MDIKNINLVTYILSININQVILVYPVMSQFVNFGHNLAINQLCLIRHNTDNTFMVNWNIWNNPQVYSLCQTKWDTQTLATLYFNESIKAQSAAPILLYEYRGDQSLGAPLPLCLRQSV